MKSLNFEQIEQVEGGKWAKTLCNAHAGASAITSGIAIIVGATIPIGLAAFGAATSITCWATGN